jgi:peptide/nickel transport system substrate-binding protein
LRRIGAFKTFLSAAAIAALFLALASAAGARAAQPVFKGAYTSFPDYMDPQLSWTAEGWTAMYDTYIPLLTYRHAEGKAGSEVIPGLAKALPKITDGGRTYTLFLRPGLRYSNGTEVRASDFRFAVERMFRLNSGGTLFYTDIVGASRYAGHRSAHIAGIVTDDRTGKIVIHLKRPRATFSNELALMFVAPVPPGTPMRDQSFDPPPATGPYAITSAGIRGWTYARNPEWQDGNGKLMPQIPGGHVDRIDISVVRNQQAQVKGLKSGRLDWLFDPPPANRTEEIAAGVGGMQLRSEPTLSTYYFWFNTQRAPFDDLKVRQAVNYAVDPAALRRIYSGQLRTTHQILPPGMPGYRKFDLYPYDMRKARRLMREADPSDRQVTVWADSESPNNVAGIYYAAVLEELGFHVQLKIVSPYEYFTKIGSRRTANLDTGFADWYQDYPHPSDFFEPLLAAKPTPFENLNFPHLVANYLNRKVAALDRRSGPIDEAAYAKLDRDYMKLAPIVPFGNRILDAGFSKAVDLRDFIWSPTFESDFTSFQFKDEAGQR